MATQGNRSSSSGGKAKGRHYERRLNRADVKKAGPGRHTDGGGLYLVVDDTGASRWLLRIVVRGRRRDFGLGSTSVVSLSEAREQADHFRRIARTGGDPHEDAGLASRVFTTFDELAEQVHEMRIKETSRNGKHVNQWINTLNKYASPVIGKKPVDLVKRSDIMAILEPIWLSKQETARRVLQRLSVVFDYALSHELRTDGNPVAGVERGLGSQKKKVKHFEAADWTEAAHIFNWLKSKKSIGSLALQFTILTAVRSGAVRQARWSEFDEMGFSWDIPEDHMKAGEAFSVPLNNQAREVLKAAEAFRSGPDSLVFPSPNDPEKMLSENTMRKLLQSDRPGLTVHGFRTSFRQYAEEHTSYPREVKEYALAHSISNKTEAAYLRVDYYDEREKLMEEWGNALEDHGVPLPARRSGANMMETQKTD